MNDDWRLRVEVHGHGLSRQLTKRLAAADLEADLEQTFEDRVIVSVDGNEVFCYTATRDQADAVAELVKKLATEHSWEVETDLSHWHPSAGEWEDPEKPLPASDAERAVEHRELIESERQDARELGYPEFEVRVECTSHDETLALAQQLRAEGLPSVHRWRYLVVGVVDEDSANELAKRLRAEVPPTCKVTAEGSVRAMLEARPVSAFAVFGGLGG